MQETDFDIIIVGGGAAGLMAARQLLSAGKKVLILEARDRLGGRIHTLENGSFSVPVETGAEFIHGDLPVTKKLLNEAGIGFHATSGELWRVERGRLAQEDSFHEGTDIVVPRLESLDTDITIEAFFNKFFSDPLYKDLVAEVRGYVEGYDAGEISRASAFALRDEWNGSEEQEQYRTEGGYQQMIRFLEKEILAGGGEIRLNSIVKKIDWKSGSVTAFTADREFHATAIIITIPLGILQASTETVAGLDIINLPEKYSNAIASLGYGSVIKILLEFRTAFWEQILAENTTGQSLKNLGWLFSNEKIPTWWTQMPQHLPVITGWLAGPNAKALKNVSESDILLMALGSLASILKLDTNFMGSELAAYGIYNWTADPFTAGAYAYSTPETKEALKVLLTPVDNTIYFAGEAMHDGPQMGTVEGALASGIAAARLLLKR